MQAENLPLRHDEESIECWDHDEELQCADDLQFHTTSAATSVTGSVRRSGHRDSISSRRSTRSDLESTTGDEDWQVLLRDNDETATENAIAAAHNAGIPIPSNVPKSALLGGTIKKLGNKRAKKGIIDWSEDLEFPTTKRELSLRCQDKKAFPDTLRQVSYSTVTSPLKSAGTLHSGSAPQSPTALSRSMVPVSPLNKYREQDEFDVEDVPTIKGTRSQSPKPSIAIYDLAGSPKADEEIDFENDFEFPEDDSLLKLSIPKETANTHFPNVDDWDSEWAEGSIGVRFGGTRRDGRSTHSSSVSALSPSVSSYLTGESEDDGLDGLVLPDGPLDLQESLRKRQETRVTQFRNQSESHRVSKPVDENDEFFAGLEIGDGNIFTTTRPTLNQNIRRKITRPSSPTRPAKTITFTSKSTPGGTRIPRLSGHDRAHSNLEPVSESGAPISKFRRSHSRLTGHSTHTSISSTNAPSPPSTPSATGRRSLGAGIARDSSRSDPTTTSAQLLKAKRSMPAMRGAQPSTTALPFQRPSSRQDTVICPPATVRPKTPVDRTTTDSRLGLGRRPPVPFLPAGASHTQSHHVSVKYSRNLRRPESDGSSDMMGLQRPMSRLSGIPRPDTPGRNHGDNSTESLTITAKRTITRPARRRNFGDGTELESFDDLPTSAFVESRFMKNPTGHGAPRSLRSQSSQPTVASPSQTGTPVRLSNPLSPVRPYNFTPRFARDTNASRIAREQRIGSLSGPVKDRDGGPLVPLSTNWKPQTSSRGANTMLTLRSKRGKTAQTSGTRPHLIKQMGSGVNEAKFVKGMRYNPVTCRWEGNENSIADFDAITSPKSPKPAPALITSVGPVQGVQIVGGMVFDPQLMCWLKLAPTQLGHNTVAVVRDECDNVFAGLDDLEDKQQSRYKRIVSNGSNEMDGSMGWDDQSGGDSSEEWPITEEFDVGPEFIKRQRAEEDKWRRKVDKWVTPDRRQFGDIWRWAIRDLVPPSSLFDSGQL